MRFQTVTKISDTFSDLESGTFNAQFINIWDLEFTEELQGTNIATFTLPITDSQLDTIIEYKKIAIYTTDGLDDYLIWSGYIEKIEYNTRQVKITCRDEKGYLRKKILYSDKDYTGAGVTISDLLNTLVTEANTRSGISELSYDTDLTDTIKKKWNKGDDYYSIIDDVADLLEAEWTVRFGEIQLYDEIGEDKTSGTNFLQLISSSLNPIQNNINFKILRDGNSIATAVIGKGGSVYADSDDDPSGFGFIEHFESFDEGDAVAIANQTTEYLNLHKYAQKQFNIELIDATLDFRDVSIGDSVNLKIEHNNDFLDIDTTVRIIYKKVRFNKGTALTDIKISDVAKKVDLPQNKIAKLFADVKKLQINT